MIRVGIVGVSGYSGGVLLELLLEHPAVRVTYVSAQSTTGKIESIWPQLKAKTDLFCEKFDADNAIKLCDLIFLALPHTLSMDIVPKLLKAKKKVIDLSGDYRLKNASLYQKWYDHQHTDQDNLKKAIYGLPELYREDITKASLIANPGCYPTAAILGLAPLIVSKTKSIQSIIIDAKSGVSGAGRKPSLSLMFGEVNENFKAYKVLKHQHAPEIELYLSNISKGKISVNFVAHLLPMNRGILETIYVQLSQAISSETLRNLYKKFYKTEKFVRILDEGVQPEIKNVNYTNFCDIGLVVSNDQKLVVITSAIDNLMKGAASQAIQNMNILSGFKESLGIDGCFSKSMI